MIKFFKNWCEGIVVAVFISILIEMILPDGNIKKYVKVVIGIYIIFTIINPFIENKNIDLEFQNLLPQDSIETSSSIENTSEEKIKQMYIIGIENTLKSEIKDSFGLDVLNLQIDFDENYENIEKINIQIKDGSINQIEKVIISNETENNTINNNYDQVKKYISKNYEVEINKIIIN